MKSTRLLFVSTLLGGLAAGATVGCSRGGEATTEGTVYAQGLFLRSNEVTACWLDEAPEFAEQRALVEQKTIEQYNGRTNLKFTFQRSGPCTGNEKVKLTFLTRPDGRFCPLGADAQLAAANVRARTVGICAHVLTKQGGQLKSAGGTGVYEGLLALVALHEVGHTIGLGHEHTRQEVVDGADDACKKRFVSHSLSIESQLQQLNALASERSRMRAVGAYDPNSIMNYCAPIFRSPTFETVVLSEGDVATINSVYPAAATSADNPQVGQNPQTQVDQNPVSQSPGNTQPTSGDNKQPNDGKVQTRVGQNTNPQTSTGTTSTARQEFNVHCDLVRLRLCVVVYDGGSGCLSTARPQQECAASPGLGRVAVPFVATRACMLAAGTPEAKYACATR